MPHQPALIICHLVCFLSSLYWNSFSLENSREQWPSDLKITRVIVCVCSVICLSLDLIYIILILVVLCVFSAPYILTQPPMCSVSILIFTFSQPYQLLFSQLITRTCFPWFITKVLSLVTHHLFNLNHFWSTLQQWFIVLATTVCIGPSAPHVCKSPCHASFLFLFSK